MLDAPVILNSIFLLLTTGVTGFGGMVYSKLQKTDKLIEKKPSFAEVKDIVKTEHDLTVTKLDFMTEQLYDLKNDVHRIESIILRGRDA